MASSGRNAVFHVSTDDTTFLRIGNISKVDEQLPSATEDRNVIGVQFQSRAALMLDRSLDIGGFYDPNNAGQLALRDALLDKAKLYTKLYASGADGRKQTMVVDSFSIDASVGGLTTMSAKLSGAGEVTSLPGAAPALSATETQPFSGRSALIKASGTGVGMTDEATTDVGGTHTDYQITAAAKRIISPFAAVVVEADTVALAENLYTVNRLTGTITFAVARGSSEAITVTSTYLPMTTIGEASEWSLEISNNSEDASVLGDTWAKRENTLGDVSGSFSKFHVDNTFITKLTDQSVVLVEFYVQSASIPEARAWALLSSISINVEATSLMAESTDWQGTIDTEGRSVAFLT